MQGFKGQRRLAVTRRNREFLVVVIEQVFVEGQLPVVAQRMAQDGAGAIGTDPARRCARVRLAAAFIAQQGLAGRVQAQAALFKAQRDAGFLCGRLDQAAREVAARNGENRFAFVLAIGTELLRAIQPMQHAAAHGHEQCLQSRQDAGYLQRPQAACGHRQVDGATGFGLGLARIGPALVDTDLLTTARQQDGHEQAGRSPAQDARAVQGAASATSRPATRPAASSKRL